MYTIRASMSTRIEQIIKDCGGPTAIAKRSKEVDPDDYIKKPIAIQHWKRNGIPEKRWAVIRSLIQISEQELHQINESVRKLKKRAEIEDRVSASFCAPQ